MNPRPLPFSLVKSVALLALAGASVHAGEPHGAASAPPAIGPGQAAARAEGAYVWPHYTPDLNHDLRRASPELSPPTRVLEDVTGVAGTVTSGWWCFRYGRNAHPAVTEKAWLPMLDYMNQEFAYFRDVMGWPVDKRARNGYYSTIYLYGSGLSTDEAKNTDLGGWMGSVAHNGEDWPMVLVSYYPVHAFDPARTMEDKEFQQKAMVHEGIHALLADMPGCKDAAWFHEGGNTWLQSEAAARRSGDYGRMGWLSAGAMIAPFMPIECYSGWLQDGSFGGPSAEGVHREADGRQISTWRKLLGGTQYGECFARFLGEMISPGSVAWIWQNSTGRVLEGLATAPGGLGEAQTRRMITEFRARQVFCDFGKWSDAYRQLLHDSWKLPLGVEDEPHWIACAPWIATCYAATRQEGRRLIPDALTLPGWSGANQIPLQVKGAGAVGLTFLPAAPNMRCLLVYRAADDSIVYSEPVAQGECRLVLPSPPKHNVVIAVICSTDYVYAGEATRQAKFAYQLELGEGIAGPADIYTKWWN